mmetsp:Transcript_60018/g.152316  ORF Transcript_60018/g.152316 Transcript_60018/m.152316 type:complete len:284 (-) Transcript_60018:47-898(-)
MAVPAPQPVFGSVDAYGNRRSSDEVRIIREMLEEDIRVFMSDSGIDGPAARELLSEQPEIQFAVMQRGPVRSAANPSAALIGRIRDAKNGISRGGTGQGPPAIVSAEPGKPLSDVDRFIMENRLDLSAAASIKSEPESVQKTVILQGPLVNCRNPSGALMARIRAARDGKTVYRPQGQTVGTLAAPPPGASAAPGPVAIMDAPFLSAGAPSWTAAPAPLPGVLPILQGILQAPSASWQMSSAAAPVQAEKPIANVEDNKLNEAAMKAIAMLNANSGGPSWSEI